MNSLQRHITLAIAGLFITGATTPAATYKVVHSFGAFANATGLEPKCQLALGPDGTLYGTTLDGEGEISGTVFKVQTDGSGFTVLKYFTNSIEGLEPCGDLVLSGTTLYGTTRGGSGTVFKLSTDGTGFTNLHIFSGFDGNNPFAGLLLSGGKLFGTTRGGGDGSYGTVFSVNADGTGFTNLHKFSYGDGEHPVSGLIVSGNRLYGTTASGGNGGKGTVFALDTDGTGFTNLYLFSGNDGADPEAGLVLSGSALYGVANMGGTGYGVLFSINTDGTGFTNLHNFSYGNGGYPMTSLLLWDGTLYGTASVGGSDGYGTVFKVNIDGTGFTNLHEFRGYDGSSPNGLLMADGMFFGTAALGGAVQGTVFRMDANGTGFTNLHNFGYEHGYGPHASLILSSNRFYGTTFAGGFGGQGTVFAVNTDGSGFSNLHGFSAFAETNGYHPTGLILSGNTLFGVATDGGTFGGGIVFAVSEDGADFTNLHIFAGYPTEGGVPNGGLVISSGSLYGTTAIGGSHYSGTVFKLNMDGTSYTNLYTFPVAPYDPLIAFFTNAEGASPAAGLILSGNTLYGVTSSGGSGGVGTVFKLNTDGTGFTNVHDFVNLVDSYGGRGGLLISGDILYGTTEAGGAGGSGTIFKLHTDGTGFTNLYAFTSLAYVPFTLVQTNVDGAGPQGSLTLSGSTLYGTALKGGITGQGTVFAINTDGTGFTNLHNFSVDDGAVPYAGLLLSNGTLFGTASEGSIFNEGVVFSLDLSPVPIQLIIQPIGSSVVLSWIDPTLSLQAAPAVTGLYTNVVGAASPYTNAITGSKTFFRLQGN